MPLSLAEYRPSEWRELEDSLDSRAGLDRACAALKLTLEEATLDGGAVNDELKRIIQKLTRIEFWHRLKMPELVLLVKDVRSETFDFIRSFMPSELANEIARHRLPRFKAPRETVLPSGDYVIAKGFAHHGSYVGIDPVSGGSKWVLIDPQVKTAGKYTIIVEKTFNPKHSSSVPRPVRPDRQKHK